MDFLGTLKVLSIVTIANSGGIVHNSPMLS